MENVLVAFVVIFIIAFAAFTLSEAMIASHDVIQIGYQEMAARLDDQARTNLIPIDEPIFTPANTVTFTYRNTGSTRLADFDQWDVIVQYFNDADPADYYVNWLNYTPNVPFGDEWSVEAIYMDADAAIEEIFEPDIVNTGEEIVLVLNVTPPVGPGQAIQVLVSTPNGISVATAFIRNIPPELTTNLGLALTHGDTGVIDNTLLLTIDSDHEAEDLTYTILTGPSDGTLSPANGFTQGDIDSGLLTFTHDVSGNYSFEFIVSDGRDTIGPFIFTISVTNAAPVLATNAGLTTSGGTDTISAMLLRVTDADDLPENLTYTVTTMPAQGTLDPGPVFTQQHINAGLLAYTQTGSGADSFEFSVTDGENVIGPFVFPITAAS